MLKTLDNWLVVTGPKSINGIGLSLIDPKYVIATSTSVDMKAANIDVSKFDGKYFSQAGKGSGDIISAAENQHFGQSGGSVDPEKAADQEQVDKALVQVIDRVDHLRSYLRDPFTINPGDKPHLMKF